MSKKYDGAANWLRVLEPGTSCFIFAGRRFAHRGICALKDAGFIFKDILAWQRDAASYPGFQRSP